MKQFLLAISALIFVLVSIFAAGAERLSVDAATNVLTETQPMATPMVMLGLIDPGKREAAQKLYDQQIAAIEALKVSKDPGSSLVLIPFLNYPIKGETPGFSGGGKPPKENVKATLANWPALAALCSIPGSADVLRSYSLNSSNPLRTRVASVHALRYIDPRMATSAGDSLANEFKDKPQIGRYIKAKESGNLPFMGIYPVDAAP
jgi:hypothetical protein